MDLIGFDPSLYNATQGRKWFLLCMMWSTILGPGTGVEGQGFSSEMLRPRAFPKSLQKKAIYELCLVDSKGLYILYQGFC